MAIPTDEYIRNEVARSITAQQSQRDNRMMELARAQQNVAMQPGVQGQLAQQNFAGLAAAQGIPQGLGGALAGGAIQNYWENNPRVDNFVIESNSRGINILSRNVPTTTREKLQAWVNEWIEGIEIARGSMRL